MPGGKWKLLEIIQWTSGHICDQNSYIKLKMTMKNMQMMKAKQLNANDDSDDK